MKWINWERERQKMKWTLIRGMNYTHWEYWEQENKWSKMEVRLRGDCTSISVIFLKNISRWKINFLKCTKRRRRKIKFGAWDDFIDNRAREKIAFVMCIKCKQIEIPFLLISTLPLTILLSLAWFFYDMLLCL